MTTLIKSPEDLKQLVEEAEDKFARQPTPQYPQDYTKRDLYQQFKISIENHCQTIRAQHQHTHGAILPDFGCDAANSTYLEVLAALDYAEDIMSFNCDDYAYDNVDKPFAKIREVLEARITSGVKSAETHWTQRKKVEA